jgi:hypothetical protein
MGKGQYPQAPHDLAERLEKAGVVFSNPDRPCYNQGITRWWSYPLHRVIPKTEDSLGFRGSD